MQRTRIKICGITRAHDALAAARAGADAIGIVLYSGAPRYVTAEEASVILAALPPFVTPVGLFVNAVAEEIRDAARSLGLRHVQLHGGESPEVVAQLKGLAVLKALRVTPGLAAELDLWRGAAGGLPNLRGLVLETGGTKSAGGTGIENDWNAIADLQKIGAFDGLPPLIAAGGLRPENVGGVVRQLRPWAVDVSSGVESVLREKSVEKIELFVREVRAMDGSFCSESSLM